MGGDVGEVLREVGLADEGTPDGDKQRADRRKVYLHCNVGGPLSATPTQDTLGSPTPDEPNPAATPRRRGFDTLLDAGLSPEDVANMRRQFYASRGEEVPDLGSGDVNDEHARALEEQWIEGDLTAETATSMYTHMDFLTHSYRRGHVHVHPERPPHRLPRAPHTMVLLPRPPPAQLF